MWHDDLKFLITSGMLWVDTTNDTWRKVFPQSMPDELIWLDRSKSHQSACAEHPIDHGGDPGYHGSPASQERIADWYYNHITAVLLMLVADDWRNYLHKCIIDHLVHLIEIGRAHV